MIQALLVPVLILAAQAPDTRHFVITNIVSEIEKRAEFVSGVAHWTLFLAAADARSAFRRIQRAIQEIEQVS